MHRRQRLILHLVLSLAAVMLAGRLASEWKRANLRYAAASQPKTGSTGIVPASRVQRSLPAVGEVAAKNLFSRDRNNDLPQAGPSGPPPAVPVVFGTMKLGPNYEALASEGGPGGRGKIHRVKKGEALGPYTVVDIQDEKVVVEFQGQRTTLDVYQSASSVPRSDTRTAPAAAASPVVEAAGSALAEPAPPSPPQPAPTAAASPGQQQNLPPGVRVTIVGNRKKFEVDSPFGTQVWYEPLQ